MLSPTEIESFTTHLRSSHRIMALIGAGLSASSGLPTFRGAGGLWRNHDAMSLATPEAFDADPVLVWQFYSHRRHMALRARPNAAHHALAGLARRKNGFVTLTQNVDGTYFLFLSICFALYCSLVLLAFRWAFGTVRLGTFCELWITCQRFFIKRRVSGRSCSCLICLLFYMMTSTIKQLLD